MNTRPMTPGNSNLPQTRPLSPAEIIKNNYLMSQNKIPRSNNADNSNDNNSQPMRSAIPAKPVARKVRKRERFTLVSELSEAPTSPTRLLSRRPSTASARETFQHSACMSRLKRRSASHSNLLELKENLRPLLPDLYDDDKVDNEERGITKTQAQSSSQPINQQSETSLYMAFKGLATTLEVLMSEYSMLRDGSTHPKDERVHSGLMRLRSSYLKAIAAVQCDIEPLSNSLRESNVVRNARNKMELAVTALCHATFEKDIPATTDEVVFLDNAIVNVQDLLARMFEEISENRNGTTSSLLGDGHVRRPSGHTVDFFMYDESTKKSTGRNHERFSYAQSIPESITESEDVLGVHTGTSSGVRPPSGTATHVSFNTHEYTTPTRPVEPLNMVLANDKRKKTRTVEKPSALDNPLNGDHVHAEMNLVTTKVTHEQDIMGSNTIRNVLEKLCAPGGAADIVSNETISIFWRYLVPADTFFGHLCEILDGAMKKSQKVFANRTLAPAAPLGADDAASGVFHLTSRLLREWEPLVDGEGMQHVDVLMQRLMLLDMSCHGAVDVVLNAMVDQKYVRKRRTQNVFGEEANAASRSVNPVDERPSPHSHSPEFLHRGSPSTSNVTRFFTRENTSRSIIVSPNASGLPATPIYPALGCTVSAIVASLTNTADHLFRAIEPEDLVLEVIEALVGGSRGWPSEAVGKWVEMRRTGHGERVRELEEYLSAVGRWAADVVLSELTAAGRGRKRVEIMKLIKCCIDCRNFAVAQAMFQGITTKYKLSTLPLTRKFEKDKYRQRLMEFAKLLVPESAVKRLSIMDKEEVPCVPVLEDHIERFKSIAADRTLRRSKSGNRNEVLIDFTMLKDLTRVILDMEQARRRTYQYTPEAPVENFLRQTFEKLPSDGDIVAKRNVIFTEEQAQIDKSRNSQSSLLDQVNNAAKKFSFGIGNKD